MRNESEELDSYVLYIYLAIARPAFCSSIVRIGHRLELYITADSTEYIQVHVNYNYCTFGTTLLWHSLVKPSIEWDHKV